MRLPLLVHHQIQTVKELAQGHHLRLFAALGHGQTRQGFLIGVQTLDVAPAPLTLQLAVRALPLSQKVVVNID